MSKNIISILDQIDSADEEYYNNDSTIISDAEYDSLKDQLREFVKTFEPSNKNEKSLKNRINTTLNRVGAPIPENTGWKSLTHRAAMASLNKVNTPEEFFDWILSCGDGEVVGSEKLDGISVSLCYENGKLITGASRGNGITGFDITSNVKKMKGVPSELKTNFSGHIRGEIVLLHSDFEKNFSDLANPRNAAGGISKRLDGEDCEHLSVLAYKLEPDKEIDSIKNESDAFKYIKELGFNVPNNYILKSKQECVDLWNKYMDETRKSIDYDIDGLVFVINNIEKQISLGDVGRGPKGAIAFKFKNATAETTLREVVAQVGDTGVITPVVIFDKVNLIGSNIERATVHNYGILNKLGLYIGATIVIQKCNDVIPNIKEVINRDKTKPVIQPVDKCPSCGFAVTYKGAYLVCTNKETCPAQVIGRLNKFVKELNILEWGEKNIQKMIDAGLVSDVADIYKLTVDQIASLDRMGQRSAENLIAELDKFREIPLENFIGGLSIEGIATTTVKTLIKAGHDSIEKLRKLSISQLENIPGFGPTRAENFYYGLKDAENRINDILSAGVTVKSRTIGSFTNKSFAITGTMENPRAILIKMIEDNGGEVKKSVGKGLDYLIIDDVNSTTSKAQSAKKNNIKLISEQQLLDMIK
jgi:DNA ligase (NAD+)